MKLNIYAVYDAKAATFCRPVFMNNDGEAIRSFEIEVSTGEGMMADEPLDFFMYHIGQYDDHSGTITPINPLQITSGAAALRKYQERRDKIAELHRQIDFIKDPANLGANGYAVSDASSVQQSTEIDGAEEHVQQDGIAQDNV